METIEAQFDAMASRYPNLYKHKMTSAEYDSAMPKGQFDLVYIDGIHTYEGAKADIELFKSRIRPGGFLAGHDYQPRFPGVMKAVNEFSKPHATFKDTSWIFRI